MSYDPHSTGSVTARDLARRFAKIEEVALTVDSKLPVAGRLVTNLNMGDRIFWLEACLKTAFDGNTPKVNFYLEGSDPDAAALINVEANNMAASGPSPVDAAGNIVLWPNIGPQAYIWTMAHSINLMMNLSDGAGNAPKSTKGSLDFWALIWRA